MSHSRNNLQIQLIIKRFPVHHKGKTFQIYNLYQESQQSGIQKSIPFRFPCVRMGCFTTCYFEAQAIKNQQKIETCSNCQNQNSQTVYLDIGFKQFIDKNKKYILKNAPIHVLLNPLTNQHFFKPKALKNNLQTTLSCFIASQLIRQMNLDQIPLLHQSSLDFYKINNELKTIFKPPQRQNPYRIYSFCKYHQVQQKGTGIYILLFIKGFNQPIKARILRQNRKQLCNSYTYLNFVKINYLGKCNTLVFSVPNKKTTQYFVSNIGLHLKMRLKELFLAHQTQWSDQLPRINGSLIVHQQRNHIFAIGGYHYAKNDSLDYISCFLDCKWKKNGDKFVFSATIQKDHHLFRAENAFSNNFHTSFFTASQNNKFAIINSVYLIAAQNNLKGQAQSPTQRKYKFFSLGGKTKDSLFFNTHRFAYSPPGTRTILYNKKLNINPLIHQNLSYLVNFPRNNYAIAQLPQIKSLKNSFKNLALVFGGRPTNQKQVRLQQSIQQVYIININKMQETQIIDSNFIYGQMLTANIDQFSSLLFDDQSMQYYVRLTIPFQKPFQLQHEFFHFLAVQFNLFTGRLTFLPGVIHSQ